MSLSRQSEEVNYWPSISDMFLVFFVMALALLAQTTRFESEGEKFILDDVIAESNELFIRMGVEAYDKVSDTLKEERPQLAGKLLEAYATYRGKVGMADVAPCPYTFITEQYAGNAADDDDTLRLAAEDYHVAARFIAWQMLHREVRHDPILCSQLELTDETAEAEMTEKLKGFFRRVRDDDVLRHVNICLQTAGIGQRVDAADEQIGRLSAENQRLQQKNTALRETYAKKVKLLADEKATLDKKVHALTHEIDETKQKLVAKDAREQHVVLDETKVRFVQNETRFAAENTAAEALDTATQQLLECLAKNVALSAGFAVEIIGHTDTTPNGSVSTPARYRAAMKDDDSNPKLGLLRADKVMTEIRQRLMAHGEGKPLVLQIADANGGEKHLALYFTVDEGREDALCCVWRQEGAQDARVPLVFRCYSGSWLTPLREGAYDDHASNRRVEMFIRPVTKATE